MCVVFFHLTYPLTRHLGVLAVNFFYVVSGFLITFVLNESYRFQFGSFAVNRYLRLFPAYYVCAVLALMLHLGTSAPAQFHGSWGGVLRSGDVWANLLIFPWAFLGDPAVNVNFTGVASLTSELARYRLIPSSWSVGVELVCYALLWMFVARSRLLALSALTVAICWHIATIALPLHPVFNYAPIPAALLPFALGALAYFVRDAVPAIRVWRRLPLFPYLWLAATLAAFVLIWRLTEKPEIKIFSSIWYYANTVTAFVAITTIQTAKMPGKLGLLDKWLGDLSYPIFLSHWFCGYAAWLLLGSPPATRGVLIFLLGAALSILLSASIVRFVDQPIVRLRSRVRAMAVAQSSSILQEEAVVERVAN